MNVTDDWVSPFADEDLDLSIEIYRAVNPAFVDWDNLEDEGMPALGTQAFQHMSEREAEDRGYPASAMSVVLSHLLERHAAPYDRVLDAFSPEWGIASFTVRDLRAVEPALGVCEDPVAGAPWHGLVFSLTRPRMKRPEQKGLRDRSVLIKPPVRP